MYAYLQHVGKTGDKTSSQENSNKHLFNIVRQTFGKYKFNRPADAIFACDVFNK